MRKKQKPTYIGSRFVEIYFSVQPNLVIWNYVFPVPQLAGLLTRSSSYSVCLPKSPQWHHRQLLPAYSDEIAQASHLFPYSPQMRHQLFPI